MSAFSVSDKHLETLVAAAFHYGVHGRDETTEGIRLSARIFGTLRAENDRSLRFRYPKDPSDPSITPTQIAPEAVDPVTALKLLAGYEYQSCEHPDWDSSDAKRWCDALRHALICALPGYDDAPWIV